MPNSSVGFAVEKKLRALCHLVSMTPKLTQGHPASLRPRPGRGSRMKNAGGSLCEFSLCSNQINRWRYGPVPFRAPASGEGYRVKTNTLHRAGDCGSTIEGKISSKTRAVHKPTQGRKFGARISIQKSLCKWVRAVTGFCASTVVVVFCNPYNFFKNGCFALRFGTRTVHDINLTRAK